LDDIAPNLHKRSPGWNLGDSPHANIAREIQHVAVDVAHTFTNGS